MSESPKPDRLDHPALITTREADELLIAEQIQAGPKLATVVGLHHLRHMTHIPGNPWRHDKPEPPDIAA